MGVETSSRTFGPQVSLRDPEPGAPPPPPAIVPAAPGVPSTTEMQTRPAGGKRHLVSKRSIADYISTPTTQDQRARINKASDRLAKGPSAKTPMLCKGIQCKFLGYCDLHKNGIVLPLDQECPIEQFALDSWKDHFLSAIEFDENSQHSAAIHYIVDELVVEMLMAMRIMEASGEDPHPMQKTTVGFNFRGDPIEIEKLNPGFDLMLRISDKKVRKLRELLGTPRAKAEAGRLGFNDPASRAAGAMAAAAKAITPAPKVPQTLDAAVFKQP